MNEDVVEDDELYDRVSFLIPEGNGKIKFWYHNLVNRVVPACIKILSKLSKGFTLFFYCIFILLV